MNIPIIGMGGIMTADDAVEFFLAGASAVAVGTANFIDPTATEKIIQGIDDYLVRYQVQNIKDLVGKMEI